MQIQLKQLEIVEALKQYIAKQGLNLSNKTVDVSFTAGRSGAGLTADISIEESDDMPPLQEDLDLEANPLTLKVVPAPQEATNESQPAPEQPSEEAPPRSSLFG